MTEQYNPRTYIVRERYKFWSNMKRKPGETIQELAARIRHDATTCDFTSIRDPQDEALRTRFICSVGNEAVLKAVFKLKEEELTFTKAIEIAIQTEEAAKIAKETVYGTTNATPVQLVKKKPAKEKIAQACYRCGKENHQPTDCRYKESTCHYCKKEGHLEAVCRKKKSS